MTNLMQIPDNHPGFNWTDVLYTTLSSSPLSLTFLFDILGSEKIPSSPPSILHCHTFERFVGFILRSLFWLGWWNWRLKFPVYIHFKLILWYDDQNLISLNHQHFKNIAHVGCFKYFVFVLCILHLIHENVIFDILESHALQKYSTHWPWVF